MSLSAYTASSAGTWPSFQQSFVEAVVRPDRHLYYGPLESLLGGIVDPAAVLLTDMLRATFAWLKSDGRIVQGDGSFKATAHCDIYQDLVAANETWTHQRINETAAARLVTLGTVAESGLIRLLLRHGASLQVRGQRSMAKWTPPHRWAHAKCGGRPIGARLDQDLWWEVFLPGDRRLRVLPLFHPRANASKFAEYLPRARVLLGEMIP